VKGFKMDEISAATVLFEGEGDSIAIQEYQMI